MSISIYAVILYYQTLFMARIINGNFSGAIGNVVFYTVNGQTYARSMPNTKQSAKNAPEKPSVTAFKTASKYGAQLLRKLRPFIPFPLTLTHYNAYRSWLITSLRIHQDSAITHTTTLHNVNMLISLRDIWLVPSRIELTEKAEVQIHLPEILPQTHIVAPPYTTQVQVTWIALAQTMTENTQQQQPQVATLQFAYSNNAVAAQTLVLPTNASPNDWWVVLQLIRFTYQLPNMPEPAEQLQPQWLPAAFVAAGTYQVAQ